jgi:uncharacterized protein (UPF0248 family)
MSRKGRLQEIFSKALYAEKPDQYTVHYRDFDSTVCVSLLDFLNISENFHLIPANRILTIKKADKVLYKKHISNEISSF